MTASTSRTAPLNGSTLPEGQEEVLPLGQEEVFVFPASFAQERLWFLQQLAPESTAYYIPAAVHMTGQLNIVALRQSLNEIVQRHEALRTTFVAIDGRPMQVIAPTLALPLPVLDLRQTPPPMWEQTIHSLAIAEAHKKLDLAHGPLLRTTLLQFDNTEHALLLTMHHIVSDGWSISVFIRELSTLYEAFATRQPDNCGASPLPALPIQYADFAHWQQQWLQADQSAAAGASLKTQLAYWQQHLAGELAPLALPTDRPRPAVQAFRGARYPLTVSGTLTEALKALSRREDVTLFVSLLAAFKILLQRYSGQTDILIGSPIASRTRSEVQGLIGLFVNMLVLRSDLSGNPPFRVLLARLRDTCLDAYAHQDVPFEKLVEVLQPERDVSRNPLFQVMFALQNAPMPKLELPGLTLRLLEIDSGTAQLDLTLNLEERADGLHGWFEYNTDLFDRATIGRMAAHFQTLLDGIVAAPDTPIADLPLLSAAERQQLLVDWNATATPYAQQTCVHDLVAAQATRTPEACALVAADGRLTYRELDQRANQLAHYLRAMGVGPEVCVGVSLPRSTAMVVGLLGVLKAGGAYVPLDPGYPAERLAFMLHDSQAAVLLTEQAVLLTESSAPGAPHGAIRAVDLAADWPTIAQQPATPPASGVTSANLAYVIYTSGSTGKPKGVMVTHRNVVNFFAGMDERLGTEPGVWLALTSVSFDISVLELFWTLARGFQVIIQRDQDTRRAGATRRTRVDKPMAFSLFYFASDDQAATGDKYRLLIEGARFADQHGFAAVWTPERHFHSFGGLYPNPAVTSAALATVTERIQIRAGSVVLPLHNPIRVAEEWAVVDHLSHGRVAVSFASGWHANDFVLAPESYADRKAIMLRDIETVRQLWRGEALVCRDGAGNEIPITIVPRPLQRELPIWLTAAGTPETFRLAGQIGASVLTHLLGQSIEELQTKIALYRAAWQEHGHGPGAGHVTLMLHTFVGPSIEMVRDTVRQPFCDYLMSSLDLMKNLARSLGQDMTSQPFTTNDMAALLSHAFERYFTTSGLFGTPETCLDMVDRLKEIGVDEIGCLIDFGVDVDAVLASLHDLTQVMERSNQPTEAHDETIAVQIAAHHVSHLQCTPSQARMLLLDPQARDSLGALRTIMIGGEAFPAALATELRAATSALLLNMYGPTETTIWSTLYSVDQVSDHLPIGRPIANTTIYILDPYQQPVPIGVAGELYIGGAGVVRGYLDRPELTAERFIRDPFSRTPGARLYRTGDLARYLPDGNIAFLGRVDHQVKLRGHRIELGEIETVLGQHPDVQEAVVMAREDTPGDQRLVAYIVPRHETPVPEETGANQTLAPDARLQHELRGFLQAQLPEYMVPAVFTILDALPLTPNGKVNRGALPAPEGGRPDLAVAYVPPQTALEETIASIWQDVLQIRAVGIHDNFFEVGGNSLLLVQVHSELRARLATDLPVVDLFRAPTINALAQYLSRGQSAQPALQRVQDWARKQLNLGRAEAVERQKRFMEARRQRPVGSAVQQSDDGQGA